MCEDKIICVNVKENECNVMQAGVKKNIKNMK